MSEAIGTMWSVLAFAMSVGMAGGLVDMVADMSHKAWRADHVGIVSMRSLTKQLMYPDTTIQELKGIKPRRHNSSK